MNENSKPFSVGSAVVNLETEEIVEVTDYGFLKGKKFIAFVDEDGKKGWGFQDEFEDFHSWMMNEIEFDF